MIKKTICILLLLGAVAVTTFAILNRKSTYSLLPQLPTKAAIEQPDTTEEPDSLTVQPDSLIVVTQC